MDDAPIDKNLYWTGIIYFGGLLLLGVIWWKALIIALIAAICWFLTYGRRIIVTVGLSLFLVGLANWAGLVPAPSEWGQLLALRRS